MTSTIETTNNIILVKIQYLFDIVDILIKCGTVIKVTYINELKSISKEYELGSIKILSDYFLLVHSYKKSLEDAIEHNEQPSDDLNVNKTAMDEFHSKKMQFSEKKEVCFRNYQIFLKKENFVSKMDRLYDIFRNLVFAGFKINPRLFSHQNVLIMLLSKYNNSTIIQSISTISYNKCSNCNKDMKMISISSEMVCTECGQTTVLSGTVFEDEQFYYQEGQRSKHGSYDSTKHCKFWIDRIQARESKTIPESVINSIKKNIRYNNIKNVEELTCEEIRKYLRQTKNTSYNEHVPLIRKIITGITPPQLTDEEVQLIILLFSKSVKVYEKVKPFNKMNVMYHPYPIYKIIEHILKDPKMKKRKNDILSCIHLQSRETLIDNDETWEDMCKYLNIEYIPTDRNKDLVYE